MDKSKNDAPKSTNQQTYDEMKMQMNQKLQKISLQRKNQIAVSYNGDIKMSNEEKKARA